MERGRLTFNGSFFADACDYIIICMHVHTCLLRGSIFCGSAINSENHEKWTPRKFPTIWY